MSEEERILGPVSDTNGINKKEPWAGQSPVLLPSKVRGDSPGSTVDVHAGTDRNGKTLGPVAIKRSLFYDIFVV